MRYLIFALLFLISGLGTLKAQDKPVAVDSYKGIDWQSNFDNALKKAKKENRPIMVAFILRGESANESICGDHFVDKGIIALSKDFVCLLAYAEDVMGDNKGDTATSDAYVQSFAHRVPRKELTKLEFEARGEYLEAGEASAPQFIFVRPDGETILLRHIWLLSASELAQKMHKALHFFDAKHALPKVLADINKNEVVEIKKLLNAADGRNMNSRREAMTAVAVKDHPMVIDFLIAQTSKDVDQSRRLEAIRAMGQNAQIKFLPCLHELIRKERGFHVRSNIAQALGDIGLVESVGPLLKILKKEKKKRLRSILIQSLMTCGGDRPDIVKSLSKILRTGGDLDQITILYRLAGGAWNESYQKATAKCLRSTNANVRAAAYYVIGTHRQMKLKKKVKRLLSTEKAIAKNACAWSLNQLGEEVGASAKSPFNDLSSLLPSASY
ncbi:MAG: hypothetical protein ACI97A_000581 [Planctomycetota bacterium]|jgi:hypothetical protein